MVEAGGPPRWTRAPPARPLDGSGLGARRRHASSPPGCSGAARGPAVGRRSRRGAPALLWGCVQAAQPAGQRRERSPLSGAGTHAGRRSRALGPCCTCGHYSGSDHRGQGARYVSRHAPRGAKGSIAVAISTERVALLRGVLVRCRHLHNYVSLELSFRLETAHASGPMPAPFFRGGPSERSS